MDGIQDMAANMGEIIDIESVPILRFLKSNFQGQGDQINKLNNLLGADN